MAHTPAGARVLSHTTTEHTNERNCMSPHIYQLLVRERLADLRRQARRHRI